MHTLILINRFAIALFGLASGGYKLAGGAADIEIFAKVGLSARQTAVFGAVQAIAAIALLWAPARLPAGIVLALCNAFATYALFVAGMQPFGTVSIVFILMAVLAARS